MPRRHRHAPRQDTVAQAIARYAPNQHVQEAMDLGALLEGGSLGSGPFNVGDFGHSRGPFQENDNFHNYDHAKINTPDYAVQLIEPSYEAAVRRVPQSMWDANPERAAELAAFYAERPARDYYSTEDVHAKWLQIKGKLPLSHQSLDPTLMSGGFSSSSLGTVGGISVVAILAVLLLVVVIRK